MSSDTRTVRGTLFSGGRFVLSCADAPLKAQETGPTRKGPAADFDALATATLLVDGRPREFTTLIARDFHAIRAIAAASGLLPDRAISVPCIHCGERFPARPAAAFALGPFADGELDDPERDSPFLFDVPHVVAGHAGEVTVRLEERAVGELLPAWRAVAEGRTAFSRALVGAWGLRSVGTATDPGTIALALRSDETLAEVVEELLLEAHYPPRLSAEVRCPACDAANTLDAPFDREFLDDHFADPAPSEGPADFPSDAIFSAAAESDAAPFLAADAEFVATALVPPAAAVFRVDTGVPAVDDAGVPLLGSYRPSAEGLPPIVTIYARSFRDAATDDPAFPWREELRETVRHEFAHHAAAHAGYDETDDDERAEIVEEEGRRRGRRVVARERSPLAHPLFWGIVVALLVLIVLAVRGRG